MAQIVLLFTGGIEAEARHCAHLDAVLDDPEEFLRSSMIDYSSQVGWKVQSFGEFGRLHTGLAVTIGTAILGVGKCTSLYRLRIVEQPRRRSISRTPPN